MGAGRLELALENSMQGTGRCLISDAMHAWQFQSHDPQTLETNWVLGMGVALSKIVDSTGSWLFLFYNSWANLWKEFRGVRRQMQILFRDCARMVRNRRQHNTTLVATVWATYFAARAAKRERLSATAHANPKTLGTSKRQR